MRILIAGQTYRPATNGAATFTIQLAEGLARAGHRVTVLMPSDRTRSYRALCNSVQVCAVRALPLAPFYPDIYVTPWPRREVGRLLDEHAPQIVHIQDHYPLSKAVLVESRRRGLPVVGTNNFLPDNMVPQVPLLSRSGSLLERVLWRMVLDVFNRADVVTAATETSARILREHGLRVPLQAISSGVDLDRFRPDPGVDRAGVRSRFDLDAQRTLFLFVSRLDPEKRIDVLLAALQRLRRSDVQLAIAGRGRQLEALRALAARLGVGEQVVFTGFVPGQDLPALLNCADVFVMPGEAELQSIATLEAMATARPVLLADARALPELVQPGVNGYLFRPGDADDCARCMARLLAERKRWAEMGEASRTIARSHDVEHTIGRYEALYRSLGVH